MAALARRDLLMTAEGEHLSGASIDAIDTGVFELSLDVVMRRGQRTHDAAQSDGIALMDAASTLGEIRKVA